MPKACPERHPERSRRTIEEAGAPRGHLVAREYYGHVDPVTGVSVGTNAMRILDYRSNCEILNESWGTGYSEVATRSVKAWWNSMPHQKCMLASWLRRFGAGATQDQEDVWYVTVLMGK